MNATFHDRARALGWVLALVAAAAVYAVAFYMAGVEMAKLAMHLTPRAVVVLSFCFFLVKMTDCFVRVKHEAFEAAWEKYSRTRKASKT